MRASDVLKLYNDIDRLPVDDVAKAAFKKLVFDQAHGAGITVIARHERVLYAVHQLNLKVSAPTLRERIASTFDVCQRQAARIVSDALKLRHKSIKNVHPDAYTLNNGASNHAELEPTIDHDQDGIGAVCQTEDGDRCAVKAG